MKTNFRVQCLNNIRNTQTNIHTYTQRNRQTDRYRSKKHSYIQNIQTLQINRKLEVENVHLPYTLFLSIKKKVKMINDLLA